MESEKFCLRWNDFETNISTAFRELRDDKNFFDVTLACEDEQIQAHKVILSACSPFFRNILRQNPHQHPLLYLKGVKYTELQGVLNFMYQGEVNIAQEELNSFLAVAEDLRIKGLTQKPSDSQTSKAPHKVKLLSKQNVTPKLKPQPQIIEEEEDDIQEVVPIKAEPREQPISGHNKVYNRSTLAVVGQEPDESIMEEEIQEYQNYGDSHPLTDMQENHYTNNHQRIDDGENRLAVGREDDFESFLKQNSGQIDGGTWSCYLCGKITSGSGNMRQHFEAHHFSLGGFQCEFCMKMFKTKHSLATHVSKNHRHR